MKYQLAVPMHFFEPCFKWRKSCVADTEFAQLSDKIMWFFRRTNVIGSRFVRSLSSLRSTSVATHNHTHINALRLRRETDNLGLQLSDECGLRGVLQHIYISASCSPAFINTTQTASHAFREDDRVIPTLLHSSKANL